MGETCQSCRSWVDNIYWTHFQFIHFAQFLPTGFEQQLALPSRFSDNLRKKLPEYVTLRGPGGAVWSIGLTPKDETLYFTHGWQEFVKDHYLEENDFLVFKYNGESQFDVLVFDRESLCEKVSSYFVRKCGHTNKRNRDNYLQQVNTPSNNAGVECACPEKFLHDDSIRVPAVAPSETTDKKTSDAGVECASPGQPMNGDSVTSKRIGDIVSAVKDVQTKRSRRPKGSDAPVGELNWVLDAEPPSASRTCEKTYTSNRRPVTENEKQKALALAQAACTDDGFYIVMRPTHVYKRFYASIPSKWTKEHLSPRSQDVIVRMGNNEWHARYSFDYGRQTGGLTGGWKHFAVDNNLEEFDACVFKPVGQNKHPLIMDVKIFRVVEEFTPLGIVNSGGKRGRKKIIKAILA